MCSFSKHFSAWCISLFEEYRNGETRPYLLGKRQWNIWCRDAPKENRIYYQNKYCFAKFTKRFKNTLKTIVWCYVTWSSATQNQVTKMIQAYSKMGLGLLPTLHLFREVRATSDRVGSSRVGPICGGAGHSSPALGVGAGKGSTPGCYSNRRLLTDNRDWPNMYISEDNGSYILQLSEKGATDTEREIRLNQSVLMGCGLSVLTRR